MKPQTYMNLSGESLREIIDFYKLNPAEELIVIYDDISLDPGAASDPCQREAPAATTGSRVSLPTWEASLCG